MFKNFINNCFKFFAFIFLYCYVIFKIGFNFKESKRYLGIIDECIILVDDIIEHVFDDEEDEEDEDIPRIRLVKD